MEQDHQAGGNQAELTTPGVWVCNVCGYVYDQAAGIPEDGIAPGTRWEDVPADWFCPECGVGKSDFTRMD